MPEPPSAKETTAANDEFSYDLVKAGHSLEAMDFLRREAIKTRIPEIVSMVDASFQLLVTSYHCILRYEMTKLPGTDDLQ